MIRDLGALSSLVPPLRNIVPLFLAALLFLPEAGVAGTLQSPDTLRGTVVDGSGGAVPVAGATVRLLKADRGTLTDARGRFRIHPMPPGDDTLRVEHPGYRSVEREVRVGGSGSGGLETEEGDVSGLRISLEPAAFAMEEMVITASPYGRGSSQPAQAYSREDLQRRAGLSLGEALDGEPGLAMRSFGPAAGRPVIRGLDGDRVLILENGQRMGDLSETAPDHAVTSDPLSADRVEVVRGPASLLYGSSALGGVVNLMNEDIPRHWSRGATGSLALQGATVNDQAAGFGRLTFGADSWAVTARGSERRAGDLRTPEGILPGTHLEGRTGSAGFGFTGAGVRGGVSAVFLEQAFGIPEEIDDPDQEVELRTRRQVGQGEVQWDLDGFVDEAEVRWSASRYDHREVEMEGVRTGFPREEVELEWLQRSLTSTTTLRHRSWGPVDRGALGFNLFLQEVEAGGEETLTPHSRSGFLAAFFFQELPLTERLRLQAGGRGELQRMEARPNPEFPEARDSRSAATFSGALGLNFRPLPGLEVGTQVARAHRTPLMEELYSYGPHVGTGRFEIGDSELANEIGTGFDLFVRWTGTGFRAEVAAFRNRISNFVALTPRERVDPESGLKVFRYDAGEAELVGGEATAEVSLPGGLRLKAVADHVRGTRLGPERSPLPFIPPLRGSVELRYEDDLRWAGARTRWVGPQQRVASAEEPTEGYALVGLEAGVRLQASGGHVLVLRVDNLLDTTYRDHLSRVRERDNPMPGRNVNLIYRWTF